MSHGLWTLPPVSPLSLGPALPIGPCLICAAQSAFSAILPLTLSRLLANPASSTQQG